MSYRLFPSASGPGSSTTFTGSIILGTLFEVTSPGMVLQGYWYWRADSSQAATANFALWKATSFQHGSLVANSAVSISGMTVGQWNYVALATPIALTVNTAYKAQVGVVNNFLDSKPYFGAGGTAAAGITNGPLFAFSDAAGSAPDAYNDNQSTYGIGSSDPTAAYTANTDTGFNCWVDVQVDFTGGAAPLYPAVQPARAKLPQQPLLRGRAVSGEGAPVRNPSAGPVFTQAVQAVRARLPQQPAGAGAIRGRIVSGKGAPVQNPFPAVTGPPFYPRTFIRAQLPLPRRGACRVMRFGPVPVNPSQGPVFTQATSPVRARTHLPPRGRTASNPGAPVQNPLPPTTGPVFRPVTSPARIRPSLPPRGRITSCSGVPARNPAAGPAVYPLHGPIGLAWRAPGPYRKGRTAGSPGGPVANTPAAAITFTYGIPYFEWEYGTPHF